MKYYQKNGTLFETIYGAIVPCSSQHPEEHRKLADLPQYKPSDSPIPNFKSKLKNT